MFYCLLCDIIFSAGNLVLEETKMDGSDGLSKVSQHFKNTAKILDDIHLSG